MGRPVVVEYGMFAVPAWIDLLRQLQELGAKPWWFDGDRLAAKEAWRAENRISSRLVPDDQWDKVVQVINANERLLVEFFGTRILRTIEPGPVHTAPEKIYATMEAITSAASR